MRYLGSKVSIKKELIPIIAEHLNGDNEFVDARLPYNLCVQDEYGEIDYINYNDVHFANYFDSILNGKIKPYLRPMSSMTEEQEEEYNDLNSYELCCFPHTEDALDYLIKNYFDYRGLIPMELAIDATGLNIY